MPVTSAWTTYASVEAKIAVKTGVNKITLVALSVNGFANLDYYYLYGNQQFGNCQITQQTISLNAGWNLFSINVRPSDSTIAKLFNGLDVQEIKNMDAFWRTGQNLAFNSLKTITAGDGYLVKMNKAATFTVLGNIIEPQINYTPKASWQLLGCPYQTTTGFTFDFDTNNCTIIKDFNGFWIPDGLTNSLQNIEPGKAYFIK